MSRHPKHPLPMVAPLSVSKYPYSYYIMCNFVQTWQTWIRNSMTSVKSRLLRNRLTVTFGREKHAVGNNAFFTHVAFELFHWALPTVPHVSARFGAIASVYVFTATFDTAILSNDFEHFSADHCWNKIEKITVNTVKRVLARRVTGEFPVRITDI